MNTEAVAQRMKADKFGIIKKFVSKAQTKGQTKGVILNHLQKNLLETPI